jgi:hypothetical protein
MRNPSNEDAAVAELARLALAANRGQHWDLATDNWASGVSYLTLMLQSAGRLYPAVLPSSCCAPGIQQQALTAWMGVMEAVVGCIHTVLVRQDFSRKKPRAVLQQLLATALQASDRLHVAGARRRCHSAEQPPRSPCQTWRVDARWRWVCSCLYV